MEVLLFICGIISIICLLNVYRTKCSNCDSWNTDYIGEVCYRLGTHLGSEYKCNKCGNKFNI